MKYFLFEIDGINYALPVERVERVDNISGSVKPRPKPWQSVLLGPRKKKETRYTRTISISLPGETKTFRIMVDNIIDIKEYTDSKIEPFPKESSLAPGEYFAGVLLLDNIPFMLLSAEGIAAGIGKNG